MKKIMYLCSVVLLLSITAFAQNPVSTCQYVYSVEVSRGEKSTSNADLYADVKWDFSNLPSEAQEIKIEVLPIQDCYNAIDGVSFLELQTIKIDTSNKSGLQSLLHQQMRSKCFKWRVVISAPNCNVISEWTYHSFVAKK